MAETMENEKLEKNQELKEELGERWRRGQSYSSIWNLQTRKVAPVNSRNNIHSLQRTIRNGWNTVQNPQSPRSLAVHLRLTIITHPRWMRMTIFFILSYIISFFIIFAMSVENHIRNSVTENENYKLLVGTLCCSF